MSSAKPIFTTLACLCVIASLAQAETIYDSQYGNAQPTMGAMANTNDLSTGAAEVLKLSASGVDESVILAYVQNSHSFYNLSADNVVYLKNSGVPTNAIAAMLSHDSQILSQTPSSIPSEPMQTAPQEIVTTPVQSSPFYNELSPYGQWKMIPGLGWCWQPTGINPTWRPYSDNGYWVSTDAGWYWQSGYPWGTVAFHYGRWSHDPRHGWVWMPDTVWGPGWVVWRNNDSYCGWAPLPPHATFDARLGLMFNGRHESESFDFGFGDSLFTFVAVKDFGGRDWRNHELRADERARVFHQTSVVNLHFDNHGFINRGIAVDRVTAVTHRSVEHVQIKEPPHHLGVPETNHAAIVPEAPRHDSIVHEMHPVPSVFHNTPAEPIHNTQPLHVAEPIHAAQPVHSMPTEETRIPVAHPAVERPTTSMLPGRADMPAGRMDERKNTSEESKPAKTYGGTPKNSTPLGHGY